MRAVVPEAFGQPLRLATKPRGRIVAAAMVPNPVDLHATKPLRSELELISLEAISEALIKLSEGRAKGRFCVAY